jgi:hypothetical protein
MEFFQAMPTEDLRQYMKNTIPGFVPTFRSEKGHRNWKTKTMLLAELASMGEHTLMSMDIDMPPLKKRKRDNSSGAIRNVAMKELQHRHQNRHSPKPTPKPPVHHPKKVSETNNTSLNFLAY